MFFLRFIIFLIATFIAIVSITNVAVIRVKRQDDSIDTLLYKFSRIFGATCYTMLAITLGVLLCVMN